MSARSLQHVVCRGAIDRDFMELFARAPDEAVASLDLSQDERSMLTSLHARTLTELAEGVEAWRTGALSAYQPARRAVPTLMTALAG